LQQMTMQAEEPEPRYQKSGLSSEKADTLLAGLLELMQREMPFRDSNLTLPELAARLSISAHNLSEVINTRLYVNFFDFINQYRVEAVKKDLADPKKQNLTLLAIAFDAGFNSKTAFNTIFKKHTGQTPSQYRQLHHPKSAQS
ncbi:AraC family transcriptional regulator, partial [candidate division KSB1 bacterium]|nr:AraC family transcriptional regulator [candidate division KSB1 bacterium]